MTGIYVHIPFCVRKCRYCAFFSESGRERIWSGYAQRVINEAAEYEKTTVDTVYFGGGTPSLLSSDLLIKMLCGIKENFDVTQDAEITLEANPKTVTQEKLTQLRRAGFNRISFGFQSFCDKELSILGRIHTSADNEDALRFAKSAGFENISGDIMTAIPSQRMKSLDETVDKMLLLGLSHISAYSLIIEENTPFEAERESLSLPDEETEREMYHHLCDRLQRDGFEHYEISNFAKENCRSRHNTKYWTNEPYIGLGAGAYSYYLGERYGNACDTKKYIAGKNIVCDRSFIDSEELKKERYMLGLRMSDGILYEKNEVIDKYIGLGYMEKRGENVRLTKKGIDISDYIFSDLI